MKRFVLTTLWIMAVAAIGLITYRTSMRKQIRIAQSESRIHLETYENIFLSIINKYRHLPFAISKDRTILRLFEDRATPQDAANILKAMQIRSSVSAIHVMDAQGLTIASSNYDQPTSFVGKNYSFRPYFKRAMQGREGAMYGLGATSGVPGYYLSYPITLKSKIVGVAVVKTADLTEMQKAWRTTSNIILAKDPNGIIALSSKPEWLYMTLEHLTKRQLQAARSGRLYNGAPITQLTVSKGESMNAEWARIEGSQYLINERRVRGKQWEMVVLTPWTRMTDVSVRKTLIACLTSLGFLAGILLLRARKLQQAIERRIKTSRRARRIGQEREESLRMLADSIAHQIRNPLIGIGGNANLLKRKLTGNGTITEHLGTIINCCQDLERVVASVRDYIDIVPISNEPFDMQTIILMAKEAVETELPQPDGAVEWRMDIDQAALPMDKVLFGKAIQEILTNALEARVEETITIQIVGRWSSTAECANGHELPCDKCYVLTICDTGRGMDKDTSTHVLDPFFSTKPNGTGLGLAKAKRVVQIFNGNFYIISPPPDQEEFSTMVRLTFPLLDDPEINQ